MLLYRDQKPTLWLKSQSVTFVWTEAVAKKCVEVWTQPEWHASSSSQNIDQLEGYDTMPYLLCLLKVLLAEGTVKGDRFHERMLITADEDVILCSCVLLSQECTP